MIYQALFALESELNTYLSFQEVKYKTKPPAVVYDLVNQKGELTILDGAGTNDFLVISVVNVEEEVIGKSQLPVRKRPDASYEVVNPDIKLNLYVLFTPVSNMAKAERYQNNLKMLAYTSTFFQSKHVFNADNTPALDSGIEQLNLELVSLTFEQQNHLWGSLGVKYMPSLLYKVRMLTIFDKSEKQGMGRIETTSVFYKDI